MLKPQEEETRDEAKAPTFIAYQVIETGKGKKPVWRRIGAAWTHKDEQGCRLDLDSLPIRGQLHLRVPLENDPADE